MPYGGRGYAPRNPPVSEGDEFEVTIEAVGAKGDGIARKDGFILFVPNTKENEVVNIRVTKVLRKVGFAEVVTPGGAAPAAETPAEEPEAPDEEAELPPPPAEEAPAPEAPAVPEDEEIPPAPDETGEPEEVELPPPPADEEQRLDDLEDELPAPPEDDEEKEE